MTACNSRVFLAEEALDLITGEESVAEDERFAGLLDESDDEFEVVGDYMDSTTGETLLSDDFLLPSSASVVLHANGDPNPAEMDSLLNYDLDCLDGNSNTIINNTIYFI